MKRDLIIKLSLDEAEFEEFRGRWAMVLPITADEAATLGTDVIAAHETLAALAAELESVIGANEDHGRGLGDSTITGILTPWRNQLEELCGRMDRVRQIIGRGKFVGRGDGKPDMKGPVQ